MMRHLPLCRTPSQPDHHLDTVPAGTTDQQELEAALRASEETEAARLAELLRQEQEALDAAIRASLLDTRPPEEWEQWPEEGPPAGTATGHLGAGGSAASAASAGHPERATARTRTARSSGSDLSDLPALGVGALEAANGPKLASRGGSSGSAASLAGLPPVRPSRAVPIEKEAPRNLLDVRPMPDAVLGAAAVETQSGANVTRTGTDDNAAAKTSCTMGGADDASRPRIPKPVVMPGREADERRAHLELQRDRLLAARRRQREEKLQRYLAEQEVCVWGTRGLGGALACCGGNARLFCN